MGAYRNVQFRVGGIRRTLKGMVGFPVSARQKGWNRPPHAKLLEMYRWKMVAIVGIALALPACASRRPPASPPAAPKYPAYVKPPVPGGLPVAPAVLQRYDQAWQRLQAGDVKGAGRDYTEILRLAPDFYPADTALGDVALIERDAREALARFTAASTKNDRYLPALEGRAQAALAVGDDVTTAGALEQLLAADPSRDEARSRLELIRFRLVQSQLTAARGARTAGRLDEAQATLERALTVSPSSPVLLRELALVEAARGALDAAEEHARRAVEADSGDAESLAALGSVLEGAGRLAEAADLFARAVAIDPRAAWREKRDALRSRVAYDALPAEYRAAPAAATVTRAQVAAVLGIDLAPLVSRAPRRPGVVVTDARGHWAASWILAVTQAGIMDVYANHTFQPNAAIRRSDLAQVVSHLLNVVVGTHAAEVEKWRAARPRLDDVPTGHASYRAIAMAVAAGAMSVDETSRFWPARPASGADLIAAVNRLKQLGR